MRSIPRTLLVAVLSATFGAVVTAASAPKPEAGAPPAAKNPVVFWELASNDQERSVAFFRSVFDWDIRYEDRLEFYSVRSGGRGGEIDGYIFTLKRAKLPFMATYILVDDIEAKAKQVEEKGGYVADPPRVVVPGGPRICLFNDPSGVTFAMIQPVKPEESKKP